VRHYEDLPPQIGEAQRATPEKETDPFAPFRCGSGRGGKSSSFRRRAAGEKQIELAILMVEHAESVRRLFQHLASHCDRVA